MKTYQMIQNIFFAHIIKILVEEMLILVLILPFASYPYKEILPQMIVKEGGFVMIRLSHIEKTYFGKGNETHALKNVNLKIQDNELCAIMGASGSGKSTLLHIIGAMDECDRWFLFV